MNLVFLICLLLLITRVNILLAQVKVKESKKENTTEIVFSSGNWNDIAAKAKGSGKYIFVDAYTTWCGPCKQLKKYTFKEEDAAAYYNSHFINYAIDTEKGEGIELAKKWNITAYPTLLFFTPDGKMVMKQIGFVNGKNLVEIGKEVLSKK